VEFHGLSSGSAGPPKLEHLKSNSVFDGSENAEEQEKSMLRIKLIESC